MSTSRDHDTDKMYHRAKSMGTRQCTNTASAPKVNPTQRRIGIRHKTASESAPVLLIPMNVARKGGVVNERVSILLLLITKNPPANRYPLKNVDVNEDSHQRGRMGVVNEVFSYAPLHYYDDTPCHSTHRVS